MDKNIFKPVAAVLIVAGILFFGGSYGERVGTLGGDGSAGPDGCAADPSYVPVSGKWNFSSGASVYPSQLGFQITVPSNWCFSDYRFGGEAEASFFAFDPTCESAELCGRFVNVAALTPAEFEGEKGYAESQGPKVCFEEIGAIPDAATLRYSLVPLHTEELEPSGLAEDDPCAPSVGVRIYLVEFEKIGKQFAIQTSFSGFEESVLLPTLRAE